MSQCLKIRNNIILCNALIDLALPQTMSGGSIGISLDVIWLEAATDTKEDIAATQRGLDFQFGW